MDRKRNQSLNDLVSQTIDAGTRAWQRYGEVVRDVAGQKISLADLPSRYADFARQEGGDYLKSLMRSYVAFWSEVVDTGSDFSDRAFAQVFQRSPAKGPVRDAGEATAADTTTDGDGATAGSAGTAHGAATTATRPGAKAAPRVGLRFSGNPGQRIERSFVVENNKPEAAKVSFEISEFVTEDGATRFRAPIKIDPEKFDLKPGQEQVVSCRLHIGKKFAPGQNYHALLRVIGFPGMEIALAVTPLKKK